MNFKERMMNVFQLLGFTQKAKENSLTNEEWKQVCDRYFKEYQVTVQDALSAEQAEENAPAITQEEINQAYAMLNDIVNPQASAAEGEETTAEQNAGGEETTQQNAEEHQATMSEVLNLINQTTQQVQRMAATAAPDAPMQRAIAQFTAPGFTGDAEQSQFLFGINNPAFSMSERWNQLAVNPNLFYSNPVSDSDNVGSKFRQTLIQYAHSLQGRFAYLHRNNLLGNPTALAQGQYATNTEGVTSLPGGNIYMVRRQDALIARVLMKRSLTEFFPVMYGVQDTQVMFNAFFNEVSQAWQKGDVFKGGMDIEPERAYVDDAMIKLDFGSMKELERMYIGYLNKEGSDPIKWSMIEFCILNSLEKAQVEQNKRRMRGIYVAPEKGVPGSYLNASTGIIYTLIRYVHENKILLHDSEVYRSYTASTMLDDVQEFVDDVQTSINEDMDLDNMVICLNKTHQSWWKKNCRTKYGKDLDFTGPESYLHVVPDTNLRIAWLPYEGQLPLMFIQTPGNLKFLENLAGEMMNFKMEERMEEVKGWSTWKEGTSADFVGRNFSNAAALKENNYDWQQIFMNKPSVDVETNATTVDASKGFWFETVANSSSAPVLTDITGAKKGVAYIIECGNTTLATKVDKSGKFDQITGAYVPTAVGDYIMVVLNAAGTKFLELERCVAGVRTVNKKLQPYASLNR